MRRLVSSLTYSNVVATVALFMAMSGGVVYAASTLGRNSVKSGNIATHAVKARNLAKNSVTSSKVKKGSLQRADLATGSLPGLQVADVRSASVPGVGVSSFGGTAVPLAGTTSFTPVAGKSYQLLVELKGKAVDLDGPGGGACSVRVNVHDNGVPVTGAGFSMNSQPANSETFATSSTAIALQAVGQPQVLTAFAFGDTGCAPTTTASLRAVVVQLG